VRLYEKFKSFQKAFRFFDKNQSNRVTFNEFSHTLEVLRINMSLKDQFACFNHLDVDGKEYMNYDDFCALTVERK
jgi:Ca2+-binding EF-hand superfamily protein